MRRENSQIVWVCCCGGLILHDGERVKSTVYIEDTRLGRNKSMIQLKSNLTLCGFGVRNIKQSAVCLKIKNRKRSSILRMKYNKKWNCFRERDVQIHNGREAGTLVWRTLPSFWSLDFWGSHFLDPRGSIGERGGSEACSGGGKVWLDFIRLARG